jgi:hypothetical protein
LSAQSTFHSSWCAHLDSLSAAGTLGVTATKTEVVLIDNLTGDSADTTVKFSLDKTEYEIDLSNANAAALRESLSRYVNAARRVPGARRRAVAGRASYSGYDPAAVRAWANGRGSRSTRAGASRPTSSSSSGPPATERLAHPVGPGPR